MRMALRHRVSAASIVALLVACGGPPQSAVCDPPAGHGVVVPMFHGGSARLGWNDAEADLSPVSAAGIQPVWSSAKFDSLTLNGRSYAGRMYASPLYMDDLTISGGEFDAQRFDAVIAATSNGAVYAVNAFAAKCSRGAAPAGAVLWKSQLATPAVVAALDGGVPLGVLSTPALDPATLRLYVAAMDAPSGAAPIWKVYALDARSGSLVPGYPVALVASAIEPVNQNGPCSWEPDATQFSQRSALALSPAGDRLYVTFAGYADTVAGWIVSIDTTAARVASSFSVARSSPLGTANGGMWGAGGAAIADDGTVFMTTGNGPPELGPAGTQNVWGDSLLAWQADLTLAATYSPWNYCLSDVGDADVGGNSPILIPSLSDQGTSTPSLIAFGSKQGNVYLLERDALPGGTQQRPLCSLGATWQDAASDASLAPPNAGPPYCDPNAPTQCVRGPLNVFGPYSDTPGKNEDDTAKMRSAPAFFRDGSGIPYLFVAGVTRDPADAASIPPSLVRLRVNAPSGQPSYLSVDAANQDLAVLNPGSPVVSSNGASGAIVWVVDENAQRTQSLLDPATPHPVLYAVDATTMQTLYRSAPNDLDVGGKYVTPVVAHGAVFVGTDCIQAFSTP